MRGTGRGKGKPSPKRACKRTPGTRFGSKDAADKAMLERKINSGSNGQRGVIDYVVKPCACGGFHLTTVTDP